MQAFSLPPFRKYTAGIRSIVPLPDPNVPPNHPSHLNSYPEFPARSTVMALYPDTSCFYRAEVLASPKEVQTAGRVGLLVLSVPTISNIRLVQWFYQSSAHVQAQV